MEDSKLNPVEDNSNESSIDNNLENDKKEASVKAFSEFLEKASNQNSSEEKQNFALQGLNPDKSNSLFRRFLNNGFDGISTNPNYKMLALLMILFINLSLFFVIGNVGKAFLKNAGIMG